jgi:hypothetical protein
MTFEEAYKNLTLKFKSGNDIPVTQATITSQQWDAIKSEISNLRQELIYENFMRNGL